MVSHPNKLIAVVYFGRRGGGLELTNQILESLTHDRRKFVTTGLKEVIPNVSMQTPTSRYSLFSWIKFRKSLALFFISQGVTDVIMPMSSPWDLFLGRSLMKRGMTVTRSIHDASPHPGERYPPKFVIRILTKDCSRIVVLSKFVGSQLQALYSTSPDRIVYSKLPSPLILKSNFNQSAKSLSPRVFLFIGRGKEYKGQAMLEKAWEIFNPADSILIIAGQGHEVTSQRVDIKYDIRWLSQLDMYKYFYESDYVVLPYLEASQSGLIPIAHAFQKPVIVTPAGGLCEQIQEGVTGIVSRDLSAESFAGALREATSQNWNLPKPMSKVESANLVRVCLGELTSPNVNSD